MYFFLLDGFIFNFLYIIVSFFRFLGCCEIQLCEEFFEFRIIEGILKSSTLLKMLRTTYFPSWRFSNEMNFAKQTKLYFALMTREINQA